MRAFLKGASFTHRWREKLVSRPISESDPPTINTHSANSPADQWIEKESIISLVDVYRTQSDSLLNMIDVGQADDGKLAFIPANKRDVACSFVRQRLPLFADRLVADQSISQAVMFHAPDDIAERIAEVYSAYLLKQSAPNRTAILINWMSHLAFTVLDLKGDETDDDENSLRETWVVALLQSALRPVFAQRMALLFLRLLRTPETQGLVDDALEYFMNEGRIDRGRFDLILDFVRALGHSPNFDSLFWIKRILAEGHEQAKARALRMLAGALEQSSGWLGEAGQNVLSAISVWLPEDAKTIDNVNNQAAVLLTPRLSFHMAASRLRQRDVGKVDRLVPFFDIHSANGLFPLADKALEILTKKIDGEWILFELGSLEGMVSAKWGLDAQYINLDAQDNLAASDSNIFSIFPNLIKLESSLCSIDWDGGVAQCLSVALLVIESAALFIDDFGSRSSSRKNAAQALASAIMSTFQRRDDSRAAYSLYKQVYRIHAALLGHKSSCK